MKIYKIKFYENLDSLDEKFDEWEEDFDVEDITIYSYYDFPNNLNHLTSYIIISEYYMNIYMKNLDDMDLKYDIIDITNEILNFKYNIKDNIAPFRDENVNEYPNEDGIDDYGKESLWVDFEHDLNEFIYNNLNLDNILDRIKEIVLNNLT